MAQRHGSFSAWLDAPPQPWEPHAPLGTIGTGTPTTPPGSKWDEASLSRSVSWAGDLTRTILVSPLPPSAYVVTPSPDRAGGQAERLAAEADGGESPEAGAQPRGSLRFAWRPATQSAEDSDDPAPQDHARRPNVLVRVVPPADAIPGAGEGWRPATATDASLSLHPRRAASAAPPEVYVYHKPPDVPSPPSRPRGGAAAPQRSRPSEASGADTGARPHLSVGLAALPGRAAAADRVRAPLRLARPSDEAVGSQSPPRRKHIKPSPQPVGASQRPRHEQASQRTQRAPEVVGGGFAVGGEQRSYAGADAMPLLDESTIRGGALGLPGRPPAGTTLSSALSDGSSVGGGSAGGGSACGGSAGGASDSDISSRSSRSGRGSHRNLPSGPRNGARASSRGGSEGPRRRAAAAWQQQAGPARASAGPSGVEPVRAVGRLGVAGLAERRVRSGPRPAPLAQDA
ncbi:unnamed protein product, partial [Symbiodinium sp. KB8]